MALGCSQYNACSDRLILGHYSSVMPTGRLHGCKNKTKGYNKLLLFPENCSSFKRCETKKPYNKHTSAIQ